MGYGDALEHMRFGDIALQCDVDPRHAERMKHDPRVGTGKGETCTDYRKVLDRPDVDVVSIVTPDHWHVKIALEALQAGKHVFCQKPLSLTLEENRLARRWSISGRSDATTTTAGGTSIPAASLPTGAPTMSTSPSGPSARTPPARGR